MFTVHNWWHLSLFQLEAGRPAEALEIYDREVHHADSAGVALELVDASALLWRLFLDGVDVGDRFGVLATAWEPKAVSEPWYVFNDLHAVLALVGAGRVTDEVGLPVYRAIIAFGEGRFEDVVAELQPIRRTLQVFGGSHAQRDVLQRTLLESALRSSRFDLARALVAERVGVRESSVYGWTAMARALRGLGDDAAASSAQERAAGHRARFQSA